MGYMLHDVYKERNENRCYRDLRQRVYEKTAFRKMRYFNLLEKHKRRNLLSRIVFEFSESMELEPVQAEHGVLPYLDRSCPYLTFQF